jgi:cysteine desulfurase
VARAIEPRSVLVSVMAANSEIGTLQPLAEIGRLCGERGVLFHSDAAQAVGKLPLDVEADGIDLLSFSAHKLYGPKGVGALYVRRRRRDGGGRVRIEPLFHGGGHERGLRPGTLPVPLVVGFAEAVALCLAEREREAARLAELRDSLLARLFEALPGVEVNGPSAARRLPANLNVSFEGVPADALLAQLEDVALSTGSACSSARPEPSHVLTALGLAKERIRGAVRIGLGRGTTGADVGRAAERIVSEVQRLRSGEAAPRLRR